MYPLLFSRGVCILVSLPCGALFVVEPRLRRGWGWRVADLFIEALFPILGRWLPGLRRADPIDGLWQLRQIHAWYAESELQT